MPDVGRLRWILQADTRQFESGMNRARRSMMRLGRAAAGVMGVGGIGAALRTSLNTADNIGKMAQAAGMTTDEVQQLRFAFQEAGGDIAQFDRLMWNFNRTLGDLRARHAGQLATFLRETDKALFMNLKTAENTTEAFLRLAEAAAQLEPAQRAALLGAAFGRQSGALNVLVQGGRAGIRGGMARLPADELITREMIREAARTQDEMLRIQERASLQVSKAALEVISFVQDIRRSFDFSGAASAASDWVGEQFPWTLRLLRFRGVIGRLWE